MKTVIISYAHAHTLRERLLLWLLGFVIPLHAFFYRKRQPWGLLREDLLQYDAGTLGRELGRFLEREQLQPIPRVERHDAFHILFDFTTNVIDETAMQFFLLGNGKISPFTLATAIFSGIMLPEHFRRFVYEYRRGKAAISIAQWDFLGLLNEPLHELRSIIFKEGNQRSALINKIQTMVGNTGDA